MCAACCRPARRGLPLLPIANFARTRFRYATSRLASELRNRLPSMAIARRAGCGLVLIAAALLGSVAAASAQAPAVASISPTSGPAAGGTTVIISGGSFSTATAVRFGAVNATSFVVNSSERITAVAPAGTGTVDVSVTNPSGTSSSSPVDKFTYTASAPTVTSISPAAGPTSGGTTVIITGTAFTAATAVTFGATPATGFTVNSSTQITATSPAGTGTVDITVTTAVGTSATSAADRFTFAAATTTQTALISSQNPSSFGQSVTFTANVTASAGTPTGTVTFSDNGSPIGTVTLAAGTASVAISTLKIGSHTITASYAGSGAFNASTSPALAQSVNVPADSVKLRALQIDITKLVAQNSGQAISGAIDNAISEGFSEGGSFMTPSGAGMRFNFAADPSDGVAQTDTGNRGAYASDRNSGARSGGNSRIDNAFAAIDRQMPTKAALKTQTTINREPHDWLFWIDVRGTGIDRWSSPTSPGVGTTGSSIYGNQLNALMGLTYRAMPNLLVGAVAGYETFNYTAQEINGKLTGDGWTAGSYLGWMITPTLRYDAAVTFSQIGYNGVAGTAQGNFNGDRWMFATGLTGSYKMSNLLIEPSARLYTLWEHENAYVDTLGTLQTARDFVTGRASGGVKLSYPLATTDAAVVSPYLGVYGDYYFSRDDAAALSVSGIPVNPTLVLEGWSARVTGGLNTRLAGGLMLGLGAEYGGLGGTARIWTFSARARVPFN
ncbi:Ig-like domain repeat protein [Bradyrhizobium sp. AUGA SZCCT0051]|nr:Ig-like domain repeat protein [Bradyrhizobium sp. AUGA SZCCT0124]MBR1315068.1 Ig-like domain repeat protein [Bradyrhizobium sp. AUGA SZCCT0051]MBR1342039.1 Ig-like domain repeat protein [Bradyrhizobium sp. AUGA SZCCT0105]MBR1358559.1 Ig-like domain repeat protein [Bradyrhizobium sp. AUGA SZCCT0045]